MRLSVPLHARRVAWIVVDKDGCVFDAVTYTTRKGARANAKRLRAYYPEARPRAQKFEACK